MQNDPELNGKYLGTISSDFVKVADTLKETSYLIRQRGISDFPIFLICKQEIAIGKLLVSRQEIDINWNYYASFLNEFIERQLVTDIELFKSAWRDPDEFACLFVVEMDFMNFVFIPFPED
ncbi:MAG: hypothetical protein MUE81_05675 [Thermoflexibacter sp.]|jgi:hypothetical protein|nr:hypothetical protein [Thermoflexibacter sp.]